MFRSTVDHCLVFQQVVQLAQKIAQATKGDSLGAEMGVRHEDQLALAVLTGKMQSDAQDLGNLKHEVNTTMQVTLKHPLILHFCIACSYTHCWLHSRD